MGLFAQEFEFPILISDGNYDRTLFIGVNPAGTDDFDIGLDMLAPPPPPTGAFDARLTYLNVDYFKDIRDNIISQKDFFLNYSPGPDGIISLSWDSSLVIDLGNFEITDNITGNLFYVDMSSGDFLNVSTHPELQDGLKILVTPSIPTTINDETSKKNYLPRNIILSQNYPNPFNPSTKIKYALPENSKVNLTIYNSIGEVVTVLVNEIKNEGFHIVNFNALELTNGIYYYRLVVDDNTQVKKMILLK